MWREDVFRIAVSAGDAQHPTTLLVGCVFLYGSLSFFCVFHLALLPGLLFNFLIKYTLPCRTCQAYLRSEDYDYRVVGCTTLFEEYLEGSQCPMPYPVCLQFLP